MVARISYKIPDNLDKSPLDTEITLSSRKGVALRPMPVRIIFGFVFGALFIVWLVGSSFMRPSPMGLKILMVALMIGLLTMILIPDRTGSSRYILIPALFNYIQGANRKVIVRSNLPANNFQHVSGINNVYPQQGLIRFTDGWYGYAYRVVGNASILLFEEDRDAVINRVDAFYRKMKTDYQLIFLTNREPQHVQLQLASMRNQFQNLSVKTQDLAAVANMEYRIMNENVGHHYRSIHQYLIIRAENPEALNLGKNMLLAECDNSKRMFKEADALLDQDIIDMLKPIYTGKEYI